ncbi:hypothetical protein KDW41_12515 [Burkholderia vietnamiensis]|nr:hypothetical protein [Burkholderia vietnamiensis]
MGKKLEAARKELRYATESIEKMRAATTHADLERAWIDLLGYLTKVWNKTEASLKGDPKFYNSPITKRVKDDRSHDPLMVYLVQARNADEHGVEALTEHHPGAIAINALERGGGLYIRSLEIKNGQIRLDAPGGARIEHRPPRTEAVDVVNRNVRYSVPVTHLGKPITDKSLMGLAALGISYYARMLADLESAGWDQV